MGQSGEKSLTIVGIKLTTLYTINNHPSIRFMLTHRLINYNNKKFLGHSIPSHTRL